MDTSHILRSEDYGQTWSLIKTFYDKYHNNGSFRIGYSYGSSGNNPPRTIIKNVINMKNGVVLLITGENYDYDLGQIVSGRIYKSTDYGMTFKDTGNSIPSFTDRTVRAIENCDGILLLSTGNTEWGQENLGKASIYRSINLGESWTEVPISNFGAPKSDDSIKTYQSTYYGASECTIPDFFNSKVDSINTIKYFGGGRVCFGTSNIQSHTDKDLVAIFNSSLGFTDTSNQNLYQLTVSKWKSLIVYFSPLNTTYYGAEPPSADMVANMTAMYPPHMFEDGQRCVMVVNKYYTYISTHHEYEQTYHLYRKQNNIWGYVARIDGNLNTFNFNGYAAP
jgi:hypothetical protein